MRIQGPLRSVLSLCGELMPKAKQRMPSQESLRALHGEVEVLRDADGLSHIYAQHRSDLFFAQGYVTARDRLFQMEYNRHAAQGRLCELVGRKPLPWRKLTAHLKEKTTLDVDLLMRSFGLRRSAEASMEIMSEDAHAVLDAYAQGVSAYLAHSPRPLELRVLGHHCGPWEKVDSVVMVKAMAFELNYAWRAILLGGMLTDADLPQELTDILWPHFPHDGAPIVDSGLYKETLVSLSALVRESEGLLGIAQRPGAGSNCFAVAGSHTDCGESLLANDTHLALQAPSPWHEIHLCGDGLELQGFTLAGLPGIGIGRNAHCAWGITAGLVQDLDLFIEKLDPDNPTRVQTPQGWAEMQVHEETILIKNEAAYPHKVYVSPHGPLLEGPSGLPEKHHRLAIAWTGHAPSSEMDTLWEAWNAQSFEQFYRAFRHHGCPTFNVTYAGPRGRIAYFLAGRIPKRKLGAPLRPLEGWTGEWDWQGVVDFEENPAIIDPKEGFIVTANNRVGPWDYPYELGQLFEPPDRFERLHKRLRELGDTISFADAAKLQCDDHASWGVAIRDALCEAVDIEACMGPSLSPLETRALESWKSWQGETSTDSVGACLGYGVPHRLGFLVVKSLVDEDSAIAFVEMGSFIGTPLIDLAKNKHLLSDVGLCLDDLLKQAIEDSIGSCIEAMGSDVTKWRWGDIHPIVLRHRFHETALGGLFSIGPEPAAGGPDTVNRGDMNTANNHILKIGPAMRFVAYADSKLQAGSIVPGGQSGHRFSKHYDDQLKRFLQGELKSLEFKRDNIKVTTKEKWLPS
jgi:penicillin G amidase